MVCSTPFHSVWRAFSLLLALAAVAPSVFAATVSVNSIATLQTAIANAQPGDTITVKNGVYTTTGAITINRVGTASAPIVITAESTSGVEITGAAGFTFASPAAYVTVQGFKLTHTSGTISIPTGTSHIRFSRNIVECPGTGSYVRISGDDVEIDYNEMRNKSTDGEMLDISGSGSQVARRLWVHHNYFHDFTSTGDNGLETIRWGLSGLSLSTGNGICEYNLFVRCSGENECISNKSCGNTYRYNTFLDQPGAELSQRHGNFCLIYGNYFRNTGGIRIYGDNHQVFSNYLEGNASAIIIGNGDADVESGGALDSHDRPDGCVITFNTLVNNTAQYQMTGRSGGLGATNTVFANNIIVGGGKAASISTTAPYSTPTWSGNIVWQTSAGDMPSSGYTSVDPLLAPDATGIYHLQAGSPAIGTSTGAYSAVTVDMDGQPRPATGKDKGADQFSTAPIVARILTTSDVGPLAGTSSAPTITTQPSSQTVAPGGSAVFTVTASNATSYQWYKDGVAIAGATSATLTLGNVQTADAGTYTVVISNASGATTSSAVALTVSTSGAGGSGSLLRNISTLSPVGVTQLQTAGFAIAGPAAKRVLIRAAGPALAAFGVNGYLADPTLTLISGSTVIAQNDDWPSSLAADFAAAGAFAWSAGSKDAAVEVTLAPGLYSAQVAGKNGSTGSALVEVYDLDAASAPSRLINISTLSPIGSGDQIQTAGFVIEGSAPKKVVIRAAGPSLAAYGVTGYLVDPMLTLVANGRVIATNDDWDATAATDFAAVGAFAWTAGSKDAAIVVTLQPGLYTTQVSGKNGGTGMALVEVYQEP